MGTFLSAFGEALEEFCTLYCEEHVHKKSEAFCITHKKLICMSCIVQKIHNKTDCNILESESIDKFLLNCILLKKCLRECDVIQCAETIESDMQTEIEDAYSEALGHLEESKSASYEETRYEVTNLITRKKGFIAQQRHKLDAAIGYFLSGNVIEGEKIIREIMNGQYSSEITFQRKIPLSDTDVKSLVRVEELCIKENNFCEDMLKCLSNIQDFQSGIGSVVDSDDSDKVVDNKAQLYVDKNEQA